MPIGHTNSKISVPGSKKVCLGHSLIITLDILSVCPEFETLLFLRWDLCLGGTNFFRGCIVILGGEDGGGGTNFSGVLVPGLLLFSETFLYWWGKPLLFIVVLGYMFAFYKEWKWGIISFDWSEIWSILSRLRTRTNEDTYPDDFENGECQVHAAQFIWQNTVDNRRHLPSSRTERVRIEGKN